MLTWQNRLWICSVCALCGLVLLGAVGCCRFSHPKLPPPPPPICTSTQQNGNQITSSAITTTKNSQFTANLARSLGGAGVFESHLVVQRSDRCKSTQAPQTSIQVDTQASTNGAVQIMLHFGNGFTGPKEIVLTSADRATVQGTIDGRTVAPFPIKADPKSIKFADGTAIPAMVVDNETKQALPVLLKQMQGQCAKTIGASTPAALVPGCGGGPSGDPPGHLFDAQTSPSCLLCMAGCESWDLTCWGQAFESASLCGAFYWVCLAGELIGCSVSDVECYANKSLTIPGINVTVGACHLLGPSQLTGAPVSSLGPPCCPVVCGPGTGTLGVGTPTWCCGPGESCAGLPPLCCSAGLTACGPNCCTSGETCIGGTTCCPTASVCGSSCCSAAQTCTNGTCCATGNVCGTNCCNTGDTCLNGSCCPSGHAVCGGVCCPDASSICDPATNSCSCPGGASSCGGTCCASGQLCCMGSNGAQQCVTALPQYMGFNWCADSVNGVYCNNCSSTQMCKSVCTGAPGARTCSSEYYCQP